MKSEHSEELLKFAYHHQRAELDHRRNREHQIFGWTASILLAIIAALFIKSPVAERIFQTQNNAWRLLVSIIVAGLTIYAICWQHYHKNIAAKHKTMMKSIFDKLKLSDDMFPTLSSKSPKWGENYIRYVDQLKYPSKISATAFLGIIGLLAIWIDFVFKMN